ncbi:MAG TPA: hypothetical protein VKX31_02375 [Brumimicrobium sp.]|nr:hypothetical protein [Brumimicrobium sp.]
MQKEYKPFHVVLFIAVSLILLGAVVHLMPSGRQDVLGYELRFLSEDRLHKKQKRREVDVSKILAEVDTTFVEAEIEKVSDSMFVHDTINEKRSTFNITENDVLLYDENGRKKLIDFFKKLKNASNNKIRILHYGDSQIEGDRMTGFLRQRLQSQFGGSGPGFVPAIDVYPTVTYENEYSPNFMRYTNFGGRALESNRYGILNSVGRFTPEYPDSVNRDSLEVVNAWIQIAPGKRAYSRAKFYNRIDLHYSDATEKCLLNIYQNDELVKTDSLIADGEYHVYSYPTANDPQQVRFEFQSKVSPNVLGFSLDGISGIQVDNIAMRGSSGTFFGRIDQNLASRIYKEQNAELFIMQFGGNAVPYINDSTSAQRTVRYFRGQLNTIKKIRPNAAIIVIGPSDMSVLIEGEYTTYPLLPYYVELMIKATKEIGGAYFDMYEAMGGEDAMVAWVENGLASTDHIHFTNKGASIAAQKFYDALMTAYNKLQKE